MKVNLTLRARLGLLVSVALLVGLLLFGTLAYVFFLRQQRLQLNELLLRDLARVQLLVKAGPQAIGVDLTSSSGDFVLQFVTEADIIVNGQGELLPLSRRPTLLRRDERVLLVASVPWLVPQASDPESFNEVGTLRLALDVTADFVERAALLRGLLVSGTIIALAVTAVNLVLLQRALTPLAKLAAEARRVNPALPATIRYSGPHDEVAYVAQALNRALRGIRKRQQAERNSLAEVAHELAAPLTLVAGHLERLRERAPHDAQLTAAQRAANELLYTSKDLLTLARGELERSLDLQVLDLSPLVQSIADAYPGVTAERLEPAEVAGSPERLSQLVRNLVRNAVQAAGTHKVRVAVTAEDERVVLCVADEGLGVPPEELPHLFERFYTRRKQGGTGIGLSVAQQIALQHGGNIEVRSALGQGTVFTVTLPSLNAQMVGDDEVSDALEV